MVTMTEQKKRKSPSEVYSGALAEPLKPRLRPGRRRRRNGLMRPVNMNEIASVIYVPPIPSVQIAGGMPIIPNDLRSHPRWRWEYDEKLRLLLDHFKIRRDDPNCWLKLVISLAVAHVPGFRAKLRRKGGRPREMALAEEMKLFERFAELRRDGHTERNAARLLADEIQRTGRKDIKASGILRRMQRCSKRAALFQSLIGAAAMAQNPHL
jgi:hypothetical protein